ncbi:ferredoxin [Mycobacterium sp. pUA109]|uniref:ferredoxin n=1 Tax=Mycobacterium sp. pUA109 TaxID=3238982 RepID=UPI00351ADC3D
MLRAPNSKIPHRFDSSSAGPKRQRFPAFRPRCGGETVHVRVNYEWCEGHGQCVLAAPEVFELTDDDEQVRVLNHEPSEELRASVEAARSLCPTRAITVEP